MQDLLVTLQLWSSFLHGAARVFSIDHWPIRLNKTKDLGAEIINFDNEDPVERIKKETGGKGVICIDAVGYEAVGHSGKNNDGENSNGSNGRSKSGHDHSKVSKPAYEPANPLQVINWICQAQENIQLSQFQEFTGQPMTNFPLDNYSIVNFKLD